MAQFLLEEACFELVQMQENTRGLEVREGPASPAERHAQIMQGLGG